MKILKNNVYIEVDCPHCQSKLRVYEDDIEVQPVFGHGTRIEIDCKACGKTIKLQASDLREEWKHLLIDPDEDD